MTIEEIYAKIPRLNCKRKCQQYCGPIMGHPKEVRRFEIVTGKPFPDATEVIKSNDLSCPLLSLDGGCSVYQHRPLICRIWGVVERLKCPHGCVPDRWLSDAEASALLKMVARI